MVFQVKFRKKVVLRPIQVDFVDKTNTSIAMNATQKINNPVQMVEITHTQLFHKY